MIQCVTCEFCKQGTDGELIFSCDPFSNIKEPECIVKWQLLKLNSLLYYQEQIHDMYERFAPMQEKLFQYMEQEIEEQHEADSWKTSLNDDTDNDDEDPAHEDDDDSEPHLPPTSF